MKTPSDCYQTLLKKGKEIKLLKSISMLLDWDQETMMPEKGLELRSMQKEYLESLVHRELTSIEFEELLAELIDLETGHFLDVSGLNDLQKATLSEWRYDLIQAKKIPDSFVKQLAKTTSQAVSIWGQARATDNFALFSPHLKKVVNLMKEKARYLGYEKHPYDALLNEYEKGMSCEELDVLFGGLKNFLIDLTKNRADASLDSSFLYGNFDQAAMKEFDHLLLEKMGFEKNSYRLDPSNHPFCNALYPLDIRMTTVFKTDDLFAANISSVIHEAGHGLYEQGLKKEYFGTPLCEYATMGMHESQSKLWECFLGQSLPFWTFFYPHLQRLFPSQFNSYDLKSFYSAINVVKPSFIRIYADEVTYSLHVILRYEIEKGLLGGEIEVEDIPKIWNQKMKDYLGIIPQTNKEGCLQDIHWAWGLFGYFPSYALGNLYAAQMFETITHQFKDWEERVAKGDLLFIKEWLSNHIHQHGRRYSAENLMLRSTGSKLSEAFFKSYLKQKYL